METESQVQNEAADAIQQTHGNDLLGTGCVVPVIASLRKYPERRKERGMT